MTYAQYGLVQASDYNTLVGNTGPTTAPNQINTIWGIGTGARGYGQSPLSQISPNGVVYASQWSTLISTVNSILQHQGSSGTGITLPTFGNTISYLGTLQSAITTGYNNALNFSGHGGSFVPGGTITTNFSAGISDAGSNPPNSQTNQTSITRSFGLTATFSSADQARYFFNAGGQLTYSISGSQASSTTSRTNEIIAMLGYMGGIGTFGANTNAGRTGSGGQLGSNYTTYGYWTANPTMPTSNVTLVTMSQNSGAYSSDTGYIQYKTNGYAGGNADNGSSVTFWTTITTNSGTDGGSGPYPGHYGFNDSFGVTVNQSITVIPPELTNLSSNSWGAISVTVASS